MSAATTSAALPFGDGGPDSLHNGGIAIPDGASMDLTWNINAEGGTCTVYFTIADGASLDITVNGVTTTVSGGTSYSFRNDDTPKVLNLAASGGEVVIERCAWSLGLRGKTMGTYGQNTRVFSS